MPEENIGKKEKSNLKWKMMAVFTLSIIGGGALGFLTYRNIPALGEKAGEQKTVFTIQDIGSIFSLESFVVNLSDPGGKRYLKTKIELEYTNENLREQLKSRMPQIKDSIILILSSKLLEDVQGVEGKIALRNELIRKINQLLYKGKIRNLYFTEFVIQ